MNQEVSSEQSGVDPKTGHLSSEADLLFDACFGVVDAKDHLATAETRSKIRRIPASHLYFSLRKLPDEGLAKFLPHLTEDQWQTFLDLDIWVRDRAEPEKYLRWQNQILVSEDAIARKLARAVDEDLWTLLISKRLKVKVLEEDGSEEADPGFDWMETADRQFLIGLPDASKESQLLLAMVNRLYELDPAWTAILLLSSQYRTSIELEETCYQARTRRLEQLGFQDYFEATEIYGYWPDLAVFPKKKWEPLGSFFQFPVALRTGSSELILVKALESFSDTPQLEFLFEELFHVANKLSVADQVAVGDPSAARKSFEKTVLGINFGLDLWAKGQLNQAIEGVCDHYLQDFFRYGHSRLLDLRQSIKPRLAQDPEPDSIEFYLLEALDEKYPLFAEVQKGKIATRYFTLGEDFKSLRAQFGLGSRVS